jgi:dimethylsulfone monooxygenase
MDDVNWARRQRTTLNPLFSDRKLKLGTFCTNLDSGAAISTIEGRFRISWPNTLKLAQLADEMEFEAIVPVGRWRGLGGKTNFNGPGFEAYSWAAGIGASTHKSAVFATSHIMTVHPVMAAKQATTIDHITGGRFALNVVTGWNAPEIAMFGLELAPHDARYRMAAEWMEIIRRLWTEDDEFNYEGEFYKVKKGYLQPKPLQLPCPAIMGAGGSDAGRDFSAKYCDVAFLNMTSHDLGDCRARVRGHRKYAYEQHKRNIQVWTNCYVVQGETEQEAKDYLYEYVDQKGDWEAARNLVETLGINSQSFPHEKLEQFTRHFIAGYAGYPLVGTKEQIVEKLAALSNEVGLDGVVLHWARFERDMIEFREKTFPLLRQAGLR